MVDPRCELHHSLINERVAQRPSLVQDELEKFRVAGLGDELVTHSRATADQGLVPMAG